MSAIRISVSTLVLGAAAAAQGFVGSCPITTTNGTPVGLAHNLSGNLLFTDIGANDEYGTVDTACNVLNTVNVSANSGNPIGITRDAFNIYITDSLGMDVDIYDLNGNYVSSFSVAAQTSFPEGITCSAVTGHMYIVDGDGSNVVHRYTVAGVFVQSYPINGTSPDGIDWDNDNTFWIYDSGTDRIRHYDASFIEISALPGTVANGLGAGEGLALIGRDLYLCATAADAIAHFDLDLVRASVRAYGTGCPLPPVFYEQFTVAGSNDLAGMSLTLHPGNNGYDVSLGASQFDPNFSSGLNAGDDQLFQDRPLGFTIDVPGIGAVSEVDVDSNGRTGFGLTGSDFTESVTEFINQRLLAPAWDDFNPAAGGEVYWDQFPGKAMATWSAVPQFGGTDMNTFQIAFHANGDIVMSWQQIRDDSIVGFSAAGGMNPGSIDLTAAVPFSTGGGSPLTLSSQDRPIQGMSFTLDTTNIPGNSLAGVTLFGVLETNILLDPAFFPPGCFQYTSIDLDPVGIQIGGTTYLRNIPVNPASLGKRLRAQSVVLVPNGYAIPIYTSNGLELTVGNG